MHYANCAILSHNLADGLKKDVAYVFTNIELSRVEDIEQLISATLEFESDFLQLSKGRNEFRASTFESNGIRLVNSMSTSRVRWQDTKRDASIYLILPTMESIAGGTVNGLPFEAPNVFSRTKPCDIELVGEPCCEGFEIVVDESWVEELGLPTELGPCLVSSERTFPRLQRFVRRVFSTQRTASLSNANARILSEQVLGAVEAILVEAPVYDPNETIAFRNRRKIFGLAEEIMNDWHHEARLEVTLLCDELGVSRSTLHGVFRKELGLGPMEFLRVKRLHKLYAKLIAAEADSVTVADMAETVGLSEFGRMAV